MVLSRRILPRISSTRVARFREFAGSVLAKERLGERMEKLIGTLALTNELREEGARDRGEEEVKGWGEVNWSATEAEADSGKGGMGYVEGMTLRRELTRLWLFLITLRLALTLRSLRLMVVIRACAPSPTKTGGVMGTLAWPNVRRWFTRA